MSPDYFKIFQEDARRRKIIGDTQEEISAMRQSGHANDWYRVNIARKNDQIADAKYPVLAHMDEEDKWGKRAEVQRELDLMISAASNSEIGNYVHDAHTAELRDKLRALREFF